MRSSCSLSSSIFFLIAFTPFTLSKLEAQENKDKDQLKDKDAMKKDYRVLGNDNRKVAIVDTNGKVEWEFQNQFDGHDIHLLPNGNVLLSLSPTIVAEVNKDKKVVWKYESKPKAGYSGRVEVHAFQPIPDDLLMIAESGNCRIIEVNRKGEIVHEIPLTVKKVDPHRDTRMVRRLDSGHYLVCHESEGKVCEYDRKGKIVWSYTLDLGNRPRSAGHGPEGHGTEVYGAIRKPDGNTLIAGGNNNRVLEVNPKGEIVWSLDQNEIPGIKLAWVTTLHLLPNGNLIIGNCHAGKDNPQLFEITREKKVVWKFNDFKTFGNGLAATHVLGLGEKMIR
jgi:WD40 repeat protein